MKYSLNEPFIELYKLIKLLDLVDSGAEAKLLIQNNLVYRNGTIESRKRAKIIKGDTIKIGDVTIEIV